MFLLRILILLSTILIVYPCMKAVQWTYPEEKDLIKALKEAVRYGFKRDAYSVIFREKLEYVVYLVDKSANELERNERDEVGL
jgi:hypothetical protein